MSDPLLPMRLSDSNTALPAFERSVAVVIGINAYSHGLSPLQNAVRDANALADTLQHQGFEVLRLLDAQASLSHISHLFSQVLPALQPVPDRLLIYFAGHGLAHTDAQHHIHGFLLPADARRDEPASYWPMDSLREALARLPCRHLLLILDCCFAGAFPRSASRDLRPLQSPPQPLFLERFRHFSSHRSFQLLLSSAHDELASDKLLSKPSQESLGDGLHSPFAMALLEALQEPSPADTNQDGLLTASELYTFLRDRLLSLLPSHTQQTPSLWHLDWHDRGEFLFLLRDSFPALPSAAPLSKDSNPYLGLRPFATQHRHLFFGRERITEEFLKHLRARPLLLLCGPSGAGKSSLVHAGLLPHLMKDTWRVPPSLRPSSEPLQALSSWLATLAPGAPSAEALTTQPHLAATFLADFLSREPHQPVVLVVDPLEELVTACMRESPRLTFLRALSSLLELNHPRLHLLLLLRSDFEPHFRDLLPHSGLSADLWHTSRVTLPRMNRDELRRCIEKPAESCVLFFEPGLVEHLLDDVEQMPGALPLLSMALSGLFDAYIDSGRTDRKLSLEDYRRFGGGISSALQHRAELVFSGGALPPPDGGSSLPAVSAEELPAYQRTLRNVLLRMVSPESSEPTRRRVSRAELEYTHPEENAHIQRILAALETSRLVVTHATDDEEPFVEPAHDALLSSWPRLHRWALDSQRELLKLRRISLAASEWQRDGHGVKLLWYDKRLDELGLDPRSLRRMERRLELPTLSAAEQPREPLLFNALESQFLRASAARQRTLRNRRYTLSALVVTVLIAFGVAERLQASRANREAREAVAQKALAEAREQEAKASANKARREEARANASTAEAQEQERKAKASTAEAQKQGALARANARLTQARSHLEQDPTKALLIFLEVTRQPEALGNAWLQTAVDLSQQAVSSAILDGHGHAVRSARFSPDGTRVLTVSIGGTARLWQSDGKGSPLPLEAPGRKVLDASFSPDGLHFLAIHTDNSVYLWRGDGTGSPLILTGHTKRVTTAAFNSNGSHLLTLSEDGTARLWPLRTTSPSTLLGSSEAAVRSATFTPDGTHVLTLSNDGTLRLWRTDGTDSPVVLTTNSSPVRIATLGPDGSRLFTAHEDGTISLRRMDDASAPVALQAPVSRVRAATFSPTGAHLLLLSGEGAACLCRTDAENSCLLLSGHTGKITSAAFSPDGAYLLTASEDGTARRVPVHGAGPPIIFKGHRGPLISATFSPDGTRILTASDDGTARLWRADGQGTPLLLLGHTERLTSATFSTDGTRVLTASVDGTARLWLVADTPAAASLEDSMVGVTYLASSPDGSRLLTASDEGTVYLFRADGTGKPLVLAGHTMGVTSAAFSPDGTRVLTASADGTARLWPADGSGPSTLLKGHTDIIGYATFSADGSQVLTASHDGSVRLWPADGQGAPTAFAGHRGPVESAFLSPKSTQLLSTSSDGTARLWSTRGTRHSVLLAGHRTPVQFATFSPDGSRLLTLSPEDGTARLWHADGTATPILFKVDTAPIKSARFSPDGAHVLTSAPNGAAYLWRTDGKGPPRALLGHTGAVTSATFSPKGDYILTASEDHTVRLWGMGGAGHSILPADHTGPVNHATFNPSGSYPLSILTASSDNTARLMRIGDQSAPVILRQQGLSSALFLPGGAHVVTRSSDRLLRIWPVSLAVLQALLKRSTTACLSVDERMRHLFETPAEARAGHESCERSRGRPPHVLHSPTSL